MQQVDHPAGRGAGFKGDISVRLVAVTQVLVKAHGPWVVIDNA